MVDRASIHLSPFMVDSFQQEAVHFPVGTVEELPVHGLLQETQVEPRTLHAHAQSPASERVVQLGHLGLVLIITNLPGVGKIIHQEPTGSVTYIHGELKSKVFLVPGFISGVRARARAGGTGRGQRAGTNPSTFLSVWIFFRTSLTKVFIQPFLITFVLGRIRRTEAGAFGPRQRAVRFVSVVKAVKVVVWKQTKQSY